MIPITTWAVTSFRGWSPDGLAAVYDFSDNRGPRRHRPGPAYWRDVGTLDAFYDAHMDLVSVHPIFNLYNKRWPIHGASENLAPAKFVNGGSAQESSRRRRQHYLGCLSTQLGVVVERRRRR